MTKKHQKSDLQNIPACAAEFIKLIIKKMRYRKKVRQDVKAELAAHFEDELKDCKTDEGKEQKAQQLIEDFGDTKLLGILLRRAKKRCRPLWQTIVARTFQTAVIIMVCFALYVVWFFSGKPVITTNYAAELNKIVRPVADETLNAAPFYNKAAELVANTSHETKVLLGKKYNEVTPEDKQRIKQWLTDNKEILDLVIAGTQKPYYWQNYDEGGDMMGILIPPLIEFRTLARALRWRAELCAEQGRYEVAFDDIKTCYRLGQHIRGDKFIIEQLTGITIEGLTVHVLRDILGEYQISSGPLAKLQQDFERIIVNEDFVISLKAEKLITYDQIQRVFTGGLGGGHIIPKRIKELYPEVRIIAIARFPTSDDASLTEKIANWTREWFHMLFLHPDKQQTFQSTQKLYDYWEVLALKTPGQIRAEQINPEKKVMEIAKANILLKGTAPTFVRIPELAYRIKADVEATLTIIAVLRYKQSIGSCPENLEDLIAAGYLTKLPMDPYSDKPLVYMRIGDDFTLYSFGVDFDDDGGIHSKWGQAEQGGDQVFWPIEKTDN